MSDERSNDTRRAISNRVTYALAHWPEPTMSRSTLRGLLPVGATRRVQTATIAARNLRQRNASHSVNGVSHNFKNALYDLEQEGLIARRPDEVLIVDRNGLQRRASALNEDRAAFFVAAVQQLRQQTIDAANNSPEARERRRRELITMQRLMEDAQRHAASGRNSVRLLPRSRTL